MLDDGEDKDDPDVDGLDEGDDDEYDTVPDDDDEPDEDEQAFARSRRPRVRPHDTIHANPATRCA